jgi:TrpR-related protein YerC/YecD
MDERVYSEDIRTLCATFAAIDDPDKISALLEDCCTIREVHEMAQRLRVAQLLSQGTSYALIQERTGASATTIARVSKSLNYGAGGYRYALDEILHADGENTAV